MSTFAAKMESLISEHKSLTKGQIRAYENYRRKTEPSYSYDGPVRLKNAEFEERFLDSIKDKKYLTPKQQLVYDKIMVRRSCVVDC